jgi:hypothetical protein
LESLYQFDGALAADQKVAVKPKKFWVHAFFTLAFFGPYFMDNDLSIIWRQIDTSCFRVIWFYMKFAIRSCLWKLSYGEFQIYCCKYVTKVYELENLTARSMEKRKQRRKQVRAL